MILKVEVVFDDSKTGGTCALVPKDPNTIQLCSESSRMLATGKDEIILQNKETILF